MVTLDLLENGMRNIERWSWKHWKMELEILEKLENGIENRKMITLDI